MSRLFVPPLLASVTLIALGSLAHAAPRSPSVQSGPSTSSKPGTTISTKVVISTNNKPSTNTTRIIIPTNTLNNSTNTKIIASTNTLGNSPKFVSKLTIPLTVKIPGKNSTVFVSTKQYATDYGVKFKRGVFYRGLNHRHWSARHFHPRWRTWFWYDPSTTGWYYWSADKSSFLPTSVISDYPPQQGTPEDVSVPPGGEEVPKVSGEDVPNVPNPEGIE